MTKLIPEEVESSSKPLILIYSDDIFLQSLLIEELIDQSSILFVSPNISSTKEKKDVYHIRPNDISLIPNLEEKIDYSLVIIAQQGDKKHIDSLLTKFRIDNTKALFAVPAESYMEFTDVLLSLRNEKNVTSALYGSFIGKSTEKNNLSNILQAALSKRPIKLSGADLAPVFAISSHDFVTGAKHILFSQKADFLYFLFYKKPQTLLSAIHLLANIEPNINLELDHKHSIPQLEERKGMEEYLEQKLQIKTSYLDSEFKGFLYAVEHLKSHKEKEAPPSKESRYRFRFPRIPIFRFSPSISLALFLSLLFFILINISSAVLGLTFLRASIHALQKNDFSIAKERGMIAEKIFSISLPSISVSEAIVSQIPFMNEVYDALNLITTTTELTSASSNLLSKTGKIWVGATEREVGEIASDMQYLYHEGSRILLKQNNRAISNLLSSQSNNILPLLNISPILLGYDSPKEYLLLFENNAELRPTGGFIGSVGKLIVEKGRVIEFEIFDVYDLDGQLTKHIEPNYVIRRNLQPHLYLRDSNFDLDFQKSASLSAFIYSLETKNKPQGVIAIDFDVVKEILEVIGPIELKDFDKVVTSENVMDFLHSQIEDNFFPGSTQKKNLLNELLGHIILGLERNPDSLLKLGLSLPQLLEEKHILLAYQRDDVQSLLSALGFGGVIPANKNADEGYIYDFLGLNEANIGVNKVNKSITRSISYIADLSARLSNAKISIRNASDKDTYTVYLRLIAPRNSVLRQINIDGKKAETIDAITDPKIYEAKNFAPGKGILEVDRTDEYGKTVFGTIIEIPKNSSSTIEFSYTNPSLFLEDGGDRYFIDLIKQPGINLLPISLSIRFPKDFHAKNDLVSSFGDGVVNFETDMKTDISYSLDFSKE